MRSIRTKLSFITIIAIVLTMVFATLVGIYSVRATSRDSAEQVTMLLCETGQRNLNYYLESIEQSVEMVSTYAEADLAQRGPDELQEHMDNVFTLFERVAIKTQGVLTFYYRIDPEYDSDITGCWYARVGDYGLEALTVTDLTEYDTTDTSVVTWFTVPKATGRPVWLTPYVTVDNQNARVISYNYPIYKGEDFVGVIGIEIDYTTIGELVNNINLYDDGYGFITDSEGNLVYHPFIDVDTLPADEMPEIPEELRSNNSVVHYEYEGVEKQAMRLNLVNGMKLNVCVPESKIDGNWHRFALAAGLAGLVLIGIFIAISMNVAGKITHPLIELTDAAEKINDGNYDVELEYSGEDEVGVLARAFHKLIENLKSYIGELNELNKNLTEDNLTLEAATIRDSLTGVKNRFALRRDYDKYIESDIHIMMLDIDDFKNVNDTYGHSVGDYLLKRVGDALLDQFGGEYSYRYGGDEFMVIIPDYSEEEFRNGVVALEEELSEIYLEDKKLPVYFSAGYVYGHVALNDDLRLMLRQADELLYKAKKQGKNAFIGDKYDRVYAEGISKKEEEAFRHG